MSIDGRPVVLLGVALVIATAVAVAVTWDRSRWILRSALAAVSVLSVLTTALLQLNRMTEAFTSWSALTGTSVEGSAPDVPVAHPVRPAGRRGGSSVVRVTVAGPRSSMTLPMYVYLPAAYAREPSTRFPVIEATHGFPGSPNTWIHRLGIRTYLDAEIAAGRMAPTVVLMPYQTPDRLKDTECTDLVGGPQAETYLTSDVPAYAEAHFRVRSDRAGWGLIGYSAGGFCSVNLALRHPGRYVAGAALSGYGEPGISIGDGSDRTTNNDDWRLAHLPQPATSLYLAFAADDHASRRESLRLARLARFPLQVRTAMIAAGGHTANAWKAMEPAAFDWLSAHLARPE